MFIGFQALGSVKDTQAKEYRKLKREMASRNESKTNILWRDSDSSSIKEDEDILDLVDSSKALMMKKSKSSAPGL